MLRWLSSLLLLLCGAATAADQVVSNCSNDAELRSKLTTMQASDGGTLTFACGPGPTIIVLTGGTLPLITTSTTVDGGGTVSLSGDNAVRHFQVSPFGAHLTVRRLKLERGFTAGNGGAILAVGGITVDRCTLSDNVAGETGGAIYSTGILVESSEFRNNRAAHGGALNIGFGGATIRDSRFVANQSTAPAGHGGAIQVEAGAQVTIERSTFTVNAAISPIGTALYVATGSSATMTGSTLIDSTNGARSIYVVGTLNLSSSTLRGGLNSDSVGVLFDIDSSGSLTNVTLTRYVTGVAATDRSTVTIGSCTLVDNEVGLTKLYGGTVTLNRTVFSSSTNLNCQYCEVGTCVSGGFNFSDDTSCAAYFSQLTDRNNVDVMLEPYGDLGASFGHLPRADSPVVDAASSSGCPATDQRGLARPSGAACDSGAIERQAVEPGPSLFEDGFE